MTLRHRPDCTLWRILAGTLLCVALDAEARTAPLGEVGAVVERARRAVVNVEVVERLAQSPPALDPWDRGSPEDGSVRPGSGSGFLLEPGTHVITNRHLVHGALALRVQFEDGYKVDAQMVGGDEATDVALLRLAVKQNASHALPFADSEAIQVGTWLVALGNPTGQTVTASVGILSAKARTLQRGAYGDFLQTDADVHPGNSGGPLVNLRGEVVGMSTALLGGSIGIGFAVPSNVLRALVQQLLKQGHVSRGWLGAYVTDLPPTLAKSMGLPSSRGAVVTQRLAGSPAEKAGIQADDVLTQVDGHSIPSAAWLVRTLASRKPGTTIGVSLIRAGKRRNVRITLGDVPEWQTVDAAEAPTPSARLLGTLGIALEADVPGNVGARIAFVRPGSPAAQAGLREGAVVQEANERPVRSADELGRLLQQAPSGSSLLLRVQLPQLPYARLRALKIP